MSVAVAKTEEIPRVASDEYVKKLANEVREILEKSPFRFTAAEKIFYNHFAVKDWMKSYIPFTEDNNYRVKVPVVNTANSLPDVNAFLNKLAQISETYRKDGDFEYLYDGTDDKGKKKITKMSAKYYSRLTQMGPFRSLIQNMGLEQAYGEQVSGLLSVDQFVHKFQVAYGDYIKGDRKLVVSMNPVDLSTLSFNTGYKSCVAPGACHQSTPLDYLASPHIITCYLESNGKEGYKIGRRLIYLNDDPKAIWFGRIYGTFPDPISQLMGKSFKEWFPWLSGKDVRRWDGLPSDCVIRDVGSTAYVDHGYGHLYIMSDVYHGLQHSENNPKMFYLPQGKCSLCGEEPYAAASDNCCKKCKGRKCIHCGNIRSTTHSYRLYGTQTVNICNECATDPSVIKMCSVCGEDIYFEHVNDVFSTSRSSLDTQEPTQTICHDCLVEAEGIYTCSGCGVAFLEEPAMEGENDIKVCHQCAQHYRNCSVCDDVVHKSNYNNDWGRCYACCEDRFQCITCGEIVHYDYQSDHEGMCEACFEDLPECEDCGIKLIEGYNDSPVSGHCYECAKKKAECETCGATISRREKDANKGYCKKCLKEQEEGDEEEA